MVVRLRNDIRVVVRPIRPTDKALLAEGIARLSLESSYRRFLSPKSKLTPAELRYLTEVDQLDHYAVVAVLADDPRRLAGVARWIRDPHDHDAAEAAIVVVDEFHGQGLGNALGATIAAAARARGVRRFTATMLPHNVAAHRVFARLSEHLDTSLHEGLHELTAQLAA